MENKLVDFYLLIDDQPGFRTSFLLTARMLRIRNYKMFSTAEEMLAAVDDGAPLRTILMDWNLIGSQIMKAELIGELLKRKPDAKIYVISTSNGDAEKKEAEDAGALGWLVKTNLLEVLKAFMSGRKNYKEFHTWS